MLNSVCWSVLVINLMITVDGKLDGEDLDKHRVHHYYTHGNVNDGSTLVKQRKAYHENHDLFGAKMYKTLFSVKRREHMNAVKSLMAMDEKKRKELLFELVFKIIKVVRNAKDMIERVNFNPNDTFPDEGQSTLRDAIGNIIENTAFYSNLILYFPAVLLESYKKDIEWQLLFAWAYKFTTALRLHDDVAEKLLDLAGQQLDIIPKREDFHNPYDKKAIKEELQRESLRRMEEALREKEEQKKLERKKKKKKPSLSKTEL